MERRDKYQRAAAQQHSAIQFEKQRRKHLLTDKPEGAWWVVTFGTAGVVVAIIVLIAAVKAIIWAGKTFNF